MDGGLAQMAAHPSFNQGGMPSGLASRRGGQGIKPLSFDQINPNDKDTGLPTPRTSRSHLLAGLRTAPKTAMAGSFPNGPNSPTAMSPQTGRNNRHSMTTGMYDQFNGPRTALPRFAGAQQHQQLQQQAYNPSMSYVQQQYTADQILAPQLQLDEQMQEQIDPNLHAQLMYTNAYLSEQQQRLQQQLRALQVAAQQFQGLNLNGQPQVMQQAYPNMYQQQMQNLQALQQVQNLQAMMAQSAAQPNVYSVYDPATGQQTLYVDQNQAQLNAQMMNQAQFTNGYGNAQQQQQSNNGTPRLQVSPPPVENKTNMRNNSPPRRFDSPIENPAPLPPPSANAFRRGHKKSSSIANGSKSQLSIATEESPKANAPKSASFPLTPVTAGYGPGQARAGEHPTRQPRNPPSLDELKSKPTSKHEGSKNFVARTRRSAITNLVRAGLERRKEARSTGSISPISESTEEMVETPLTDNDSVSGRSGSGSLVDNDDAECSLPSSRTSTGSWGAIGSDRPSSRQKVNRDSVDSTHSSDSEGVRDAGSFASLLKKRASGAKAELLDGQRKAPMLVLTSAEKRKLAV
ncbi:hypothetical protein V8F20_011215 [Naviculisporaceae sp. PSN 640]